MNNTFDLRRFGRYFGHELFRARGAYYLTFIIEGALPVIFFAVYQLFYHLGGGQWGPANPANRVTAIVAALCIVAITFPIKMYGPLTERRRGSDFLMLPASGFEKWLSIFLMTCVVVPVCLLAYLGMADAALCLLFPGNYGHLIDPGLLFRIDLGNYYGWMNDEYQAVSFVISPMLILLANWAENILAFTLGSICFKNAKFAKTVLCYMAFILLCCLISIALAKNGDMSLVFPDDESFMRAMKWMVTVIYAVLTGGLLGGVYARVKTLKH